ncbi:unnamed protein product [Protopolystoma xenopodis]|uniref:BTB domain-containing protein n=1 Tax=Protopolystoma xenopodis TaxID=117903 RepID=A0A448XN68_9PLAT|nr:unnamed protein product [Protopolystoma xenopodis]
MNSKFAGGLVLSRFLTDETGSNCGDFTFNEQDLLLICCREINLNDQPSQLMVSHPKIPGLSWIIFFYQTGPNQYQPRIAFDFPSYLRADCEVCIQFGGMHWLVKHKFEGSAWLTTSLPPKVMNERWVTQGTVKRVEVRINITKIWFKFPLFTVCCHPLDTKLFVRQPDFTIPDHLSDVQLMPQDNGNRRLFAHRQILAMHSPWFTERFKSSAALNNGDIGPVISIPFEYEAVLFFLRFIYPNGDLSLTSENVEGLMDMAKEYQIPNIIRKCEKFLYKYLEGGSALIAYYLARKHELPKLQEAALMHLAELNASQLRARLNLDMKDKPADVHEVLLNDLCLKLSGSPL